LTILTENWHIDHFCAKERSQQLCFFYWFFVPDRHTDGRRPQFGLLGLPHVKAAV